MNTKQHQRKVRKILESIDIGVMVSGLTLIFIFIVEFIHLVSGK